MAFVKPEIEVVRFAADDIIATSGVEERKNFSVTVPKRKAVAGETTTHTCDNYYTHYYICYDGMPHSEVRTVYIDGTYSGTTNWGPYGTALFDADFGKWFIETQNGYQECYGGSSH